MYLLRTSFSVTTIKIKEEYGWSGNFFIFIEEEKGTVLSSYFWGYILPQVPASMIAIRFGGKYYII